MRVLLCHQPTDGGVARHVCDLIDGLDGKGHEVVLCSPAIPDGARRSVFHVRVDLERAVAPRADIVACGRFARIVRSLHPDVVHAHSSKAGAIARLAKLISPRVPVLYTPHGYAFAGYFSRSPERLAYLAVERALAPIASRVVCVCEAEARLARSIGPPSRVRVNHNGIAPAGAGAVDPLIGELSRQGPVIGALTLLRPGKGLETLIAAVPHVVARHPRAQVAIVGEGPDLADLQAQARTLGVARAVCFIGARADPLSALRGMGLFVHPSWAEAFPYVVLEAMSLSLPIVASDVGGIGEAITDGESGVLIPPRDERALARALIDLLDNSNKATRLGDIALRRVRRDFTREKMIDRLSELYEECAARSSPPPGAPPPRGRFGTLADGY
ncbi:MAG: glycosyltransferase family 4 protein [Actinobacteria bacterium]|nr:MAG: glycosyltransferase family 4 protein [Actinomycetota bacterium]